MAPSMQHKIGIFPASRGIGGGTVKHILNRLSPKDLVFIARHPEKLASEAALGAEVRRANYDDDATVQVAFRGIKTLFLISYASVEHEHRVERHKLAIDAAIASGVEYIFYGSLGFAGSESNKETVAHVMKPHLDTERYLEDCRKSHSGFDFTIIREGLYTESYPLYTAFFDPAQPRSEVKIPHDGSGPGIAWVKREELGEGTAELILRYVRDPQGFTYRSKTVLLSGNKSLTLSETVKMLSEIANIPVTIRQVSDDEFATQPQVPPNFTYRGVDYSKAWASSFEAFRRGEAASASPLLSELLGREPEEFETTVRKSMSA
ncbi:Quinone oxidoreductase 2 [Colletotrichum siamense]|uniref:Quinone oxidoreductase 2 n=1 Tax=Colletotrichum siamense TaxID=690259 RepID=UPI001872700F|nr:Quinone oxidoreductase 2 [Colletotrichum siamense]KAF5506048.1 Quinone oxidoreductase 2 [Colletotrichum siamense]